MPRIRRLAVLLTVAMLAVAGCSGSNDQSGSEAAPDSQASAASEQTGAEESADRADGEAGAGAEASAASEQAAAEESAPQRIVSLSPTATEVLFAIGAGEQVIAVDQFSNYPPEAPVTDLSGWDPNVEAVASYQPDLVVIANDANDLIAGLTALEIPVLVSAAPRDIESGYDVMVELGAATGRQQQAASLVASLRADIEAALAAAPSTPVRVYHELDDLHYSASSFGFIGAVYAALGAENIADAADPGNTGYPQLTEEYIIDADPQLIVIGDQSGYTADDVAARPGWQQVTAVRNGDIAVVNADTSSRWGPRLAQFVEAVSNALAAAAAH